MGCVLNRYLTSEMSILGMDRANYGNAGQKKFKALFPPLASWLAINISAWDDLAGNCANHIIR